MNRETVLSGKGHSRGNAKSAGTGDMPIPGLVTSRRQPRPKKKAEPERVQPVFDLKAEVKALKALKAAQAAAAAAKQKRKRERSRSRSNHRRARSSSSSVSDREDNDAKEKAREQEEREIEEEEERLRKETEERWKAAQAEREARQREEMRLAEERRMKDERRHLERKKKLKGAFATGESDEEDEGEKKKRELAEMAKRQARAEILKPSDEPISRLKPDSISTAADLAIPASGAGRSSQDAVSIRSQLADPAGSRNFTPGEVAEKYKLLQEMKRRFRRTEFGGSGPQDREKIKNRSRSRRRGKSRSPSTSKYDSLWIRPGGK